MAKIWEVEYLVKSRLGITKQDDGQLVPFESMMTIVERIEGDDPVTVLSEARKHETFYIDHLGSGSISISRISSPKFT